MIAVFCPFHDRPDLAHEQLVNYRKLFDGKVRFFVHLSSDARETYINEYNVIEKEYEDVEIVSISLQTSFNCIFGAFLSCSSHLFENYNKLDFSHVYLHSDADLLLREGIYQHIINTDIAFGSSHHNIPDKDNDLWGHSENMHADTTFLNILQSINLSDKSLYRGRQEGSFFPFDIWSEIYNIANGFFPWEEYFTSSRVWPLEEVFIPTICRNILNISQRGKHVIFTKPVTQKGGRSNPDNAFSLEEIKDFMLNGELTTFGVKRFPLDINHPVRKYVRKEILGFEEELTLPW